MDIIHYFFEAKRISGEDCVRKVKKKKKVLRLKSRLVRVVREAESEKRESFQKTHKS